MKDINEEKINLLQCHKGGKLGEEKIGAQILSLPFFQKIIYERTVAKFLFNLFCVSIFINFRDKLNNYDQHIIYR